MSINTKTPARVPHPANLVLPFKHPPQLDPSCVLALLPQWDDKWVDYSGHGNHGIVHGAKPTAKGPLGFAYEFDGVNDHIAIADSPTLYLKDRFTIALRFNPYLPAWGPLMTKDGVVPAVREWGCWFTPSRTIYLELGTDGSTLPHPFTSNTPITLHTWNTAVYTYDGSLITISLNGALDMTPATWIGPLFDTTQSIHIGQRAGHHFTGLIAEVLIYNRAFSANEIRELDEARPHV